MARAVSQMLKSSGALGLATMISRVLGMVREMVYARFMGDGWVAGAFVLAFQIPNLFRRLLGEGALTAAFIPVFKEKEKTGTPAEMWRAANAMISGLVAVSGILIALAMTGLSLVLLFGGLPEQTRLLLSLLRLMFPYMLLVCVAAVFIAMLNARGHFFIPAMGATMLNVVMIASVLWLAPRLGTELKDQIFGLAIGVLLAGLAQAAFQLPSLRQEGYRPAWVSPWRDETVRRVVRLMIPGAIGLAAVQINVLLTQALAFWVNPTIVASFGYAVRLMELPQGVIGISFATYLLPTLAGLAAEKNFGEFRATIQKGLAYVFYINLLASVLLLVLAEPVVRLLFERGQFGPLATQRAALALACLAPSLAAYSMVTILARGFYALSDTQTPMKISIFCLGVNLVLVFLLVFPFAQGGLGMANTLSATANAALLYYALRRKLRELDLGEMQPHLLIVLLLALGAGVTAWVSAWGWEYGFGHSTLARKIGAVFVPMSLAAALYLAGGAWFKIGMGGEAWKILKTRLNRKRA